MATIEVARYAGACYGVERALDMAYTAAKDASGPVNTLGPLIHNPLVVQDLEREGVSVVDDVEQADSGTVIVRTHGVVPSVVDRARERGLAVVDATCPYVKKVHHAARRLVSEGFQLVIVGEAGHPEVEGILGAAGGSALVVQEASELESVELSRRVGVVVQTTQTASALSRVVAAIAPRVSELPVVNTICEATSERQQAARELASSCDCMIVIGGKNSANTCRLAQICTEACRNTHHIEDSDEMLSTWLEGVEHIGVTAGASTPSSHIKRACERLQVLLDAR